MAADLASHQLVGFVTKMYPTFGYINNEIFFQRKCVIGPMVEVGDNVAASAIYQPHMPIKWSAEKVWRVEHSGRSREKEEASIWKGQSHSPRENYSKSTSHERDVRPGLNDQRRVEKRSHITEREGGRSLKSPVRERRKSPADTTHHSSPLSDVHSRTAIGSKRMLNVKEFLFADLKRRFPTCLPPVDLYRVRCSWQDSFPLLKPFQPEYSTTYQVIKEPCDHVVDSPQPAHDDSGYSAYVLLLSLPAMADLMEKIVVRAESSSRVRGSLRKYIKIVALGKGEERLKAVGGFWDPELDGSDPGTNPKTLVNTAIRTCKQLIGLDLSYCTQWHRFLEFRYSRTEGSTAQPTSILFPGSQLWGRAFEDSPTADVIPPSKPFHQISVYFIPNVWSLMPTDEEWPLIKTAYENVLSSKGPSVFPMCPFDVKKFSGLESTSKEIGDEKSKAVDERSLNSQKPLIDDNTAENSTLSKPDDSFKSISPAPLDDVLAARPLADPDQISKVASVFEAEDGSESLDLKSPTTQGNQFQEGSEKGHMKPHNEFNLANMKVSELREQLKARDLPTEGVKAQLLARLKSAIHEEQESAKKAEKEKEDRAKVSQEAAPEKSLQVWDKQTKPASEIESGSKLKTDLPKPALRDIPSLILIRRRNVDFSIQSVGLDVVMDSKSNFMDSRSYELMFCVHTIFDMLRRDSVFTLFRALVTAADRGICAKPRKRSEPDYAAKRARLERGDRTSVTKDDDCKEVPLYTTDLPLLFACTVLDTSYKSYFLSSEVEDFILSLGLPMSRYQLRSLIYKVLDHGRFHYRSLTDSEEPLSLTNKSSLIFSDIDDDEYLVELVRGGDAILDEQTDAIPSGSIIVLQKSDNADGSKISHPDELFQHIRTSEQEQHKLMTKIRLQEQEISRLRASVADFANLKEKFSKTVSGLEECRRRLRDERDKVDTMARVLDQQASVLDACRSALRQASSRAHNRHSTSESCKQSSKRSLSPCSTTSNKDSVKSPKKTRTPESSVPGGDITLSCCDSDTAKYTEVESGNDAAMSELSTSLGSHVKEDLVNGVKNELETITDGDDRKAAEVLDSQLVSEIKETEPSITV